MGSCIVLRNSILIASSLARIRFLIVLRPMTNEPHLRDRVQKCVNVNRRSNLTPVLPHLRMLLSHVGYSADGRRVRGFVHARTIEGTGGVAECPLHAASPPVPGSPAGAAPSDMCGMIVSVALRLSDRNKRCTMVCCGGP